MAKGVLTFRHPEYYLFFTETRNGRKAARKFLARLDERTDNRDKPVSIAALIAQLKAIHAWGVSAPPIYRVFVTRSWWRMAITTGWCPAATRSTWCGAFRAPNWSSMKMPGMEASSSTMRRSSTKRWSP
jgi:hypothetical protein